jgi:hypothetical protein
MFKSCIHAFLRKTNSRITICLPPAASPEVRDLWATLNMDIVPTTPAQFGDLLRKDYERYGRLIKTAGIKIQQ